MPDSGLSSAILGAILTILIAAAAVAAYWREMEFGQRVYACLAFPLILGYFCFGPYISPVDKSVHWGFVWNPPQYEDETVKAMLTPELVGKIEAQGGASPDFVANSISQPMLCQVRLHRMMGLVLAVVGLAGWFVLPPLLDRVAYRRSAADDSEHGAADAGKPESDI